MKDKIQCIFDKHNGNLSLKDARSEGLSPMTLDRLAEKDKIEKVAPGFYTLKEAFVDELYLAQSIYSRGIFSHETALDLFQVGTYIPKKINMMFPKGYNVSKEKLDEYAIQPHYTNKENFDLGITETESFYGNNILVYDLERTLCDMWNPRYKASVEVKQEALKEYMTSTSRNTNKLRRYMDILKSPKEMTLYMLPLY
ncbi:type IV toxin-antitoxin system AbiEi family antitoxin domain-containing protein [Enterococcus hirae]|uniref:type IV toxin-antitoxin system AbiEi family antitoxin domain-containing protein n=1 Tax=Enterococcus hirae TaxID=1354 RepID=UPI0018977D4B|nr:type IV toxin-antitoxin system AbiEi family antitoxin domain-containing protein [Enterococcus hirae]